QEEVRERGGHTEAKCLGIVRNRVRQAGSHLVKEHEEHSVKLRERYEGALFDSMIIDRIGVAELLGSRENLYTAKSERSNEIKKDFTHLVREVLRRMGKD
ncbi:MAG TPA: hypothetical protein PLB73_09495, partial [Leptospiraceae bacterium]|nr:hypothetical protein [Leptospiraceae bacterium]